MRRASSRRPNAATATSSSVTRPDEGVMIPARRRRSVVFPDPFGPRTPTIVPRWTANDTSSSTASRAYAKRTLSTCSNADTDDGAATQRRKSKRLFVFAVGNVEQPRVRVQVARHAKRAADVRNRVSGRVEESAERAEVRLDVEHARSRCHVSEERDAIGRPRGADRALVARP